MMGGRTVRWETKDSREGSRSSPFRLISVIMGDQLNFGVVHDVLVRHRALNCLLCDEVLWLRNNMCYPLSLPPPSILFAVSRVEECLCESCSCAIVMPSHAHKTSTDRRELT